MRALSVGIAVAATLIGAAAAARLHLDAGPMIITVAAGLFFAAVVLGRR
jgi:ABC-type Mn2+/Zn2+ transport system permease subunit